jgi:hypothetical protein
MDRHAKVLTPGSPFYNNPLAFAMKSYAFCPSDARSTRPAHAPQLTRSHADRCFKCKKVYFGGERDCEQNAVEGDRPPEEFVCHDCAELGASACKDRSHLEFHNWKCRFCCRLAVWFCWGTTHFCDE